MWQQLASSNGDRNFCFGQRKVNMDVACLYNHGASSLLYRYCVHVTFVLNLARMVFIADPCLHILKVLDIAPFGSSWS